MVASASAVVSSSGSGAGSSEAASLADSAAPAAGGSAPAGMVTTVPLSTDMPCTAPSVPTARCPSAPT